MFPISEKLFGGAIGIFIAVVLALIVGVGVTYYVYMSIKGRAPMAGATPLIEEQETMDGITNPNYPSRKETDTDLELSNSHGQSAENGGYVTRPHAESTAGE